MTNPVPTSRQFVTAGGVLGLHRSAIPRVVVENVQPSTGDGPFGQQWPAQIVPEGTSINRNLKTMISQQAHWKNDYGSAVQVQVEIERQRRTLHIASPNFAFFREAHTVAIGYDTPTVVRAPAPDNVNNWLTETGGGIDVGVRTADGVTSPVYGRYRQSIPSSTLTMPLRRLEPEQAIDVRFLVSLITPFRWWVVSGDAAAEAYAFGSTIRIVAYPEPLVL